MTTGSTRECASVKVTGPPLQRTMGDCAGGLKCRAARGDYVASPGKKFHETKRKATDREEG